MSTSRSQVGGETRAERARKIEPQLADGELVKVAGAENQPEAELLQSILLEGGVPSVLRRSRGFDVPDFLAAGQRDVLVQASQLKLARAVLPHADQKRLQPLSGAVGVRLRVLAGVLITVALIPVVLWLAIDLVL